MNNDIIINLPFNFFSIIYFILENFVMLHIINFFLNYMANNIFGNLLFSYATLYFIIIKLNYYAVENRLINIISYTTKFFGLLTFKLVYNIIYLLM